MAVGFTPKHIEDLYLEQFTAQQFLVLAVETAKKIEWRIDFLSETGFIANTNRGMFKWNAEITFKIEGDKATIKSESTGSEMMDWGRNKKTVKQFTDLFTELKYSVNTNELDLNFEELKLGFASSEEDVLSQPPPTTSEKISDFFSLFKPRTGYFITPILIDLNILVFILMVASGVNFMLPDNQSLIQWGANFRPVTLEGEWWRLITNCFLHIGVFHLLMNMYALLYIGLLLEHRLGNARFISAYLLTGITASVASLWWHDMTISAGASGAIFGLYGVFLAMLTTNLIEKTARKALLTSIGIFVAYNLLYGMKGGIDNAAHIGGLIGGLIIGYAFIPGLKKPEANNVKGITICSLVVVVFVSSFIICKKIPNDIGKYDAKMKAFISTESMALEVYKLPKDAPKDTILNALKEKGIYYWNENIKLIADVEKLNIPAVLYDKNMKLKKYCELRIKCYELIYKAVTENSNQYKDQITSYNNEIETIIDELSDRKQSK